MAVGKQYNTAMYLEKCLKTQTRGRLDEVLAAVNGTLSVHQRDFLNLMIGHYDALRFHLADVETSILNEASPKSEHIDRLATIPGISATASILRMVQYYFQIIEYLNLMKNTRG